MPLCMNFSISPARKKNREIGMRWTCSWAVLMFTSLPVWAADWPQWLGPNRDNSSSEKISPWTARPKVLWRQPVGEGNSSPGVADGRVLGHVKIAAQNEE